MGEQAEMRYIDKKLWKLLQRFEELGDFDNTREAQRKLADKLEKMPLGELLNHAETMPQETQEKRGKEEDPLLKV